VYIPQDVLSYIVGLKFNLSGQLGTKSVEIVRLYVEEGLGLNKIAEILGRSSRTPLTQIRKPTKLWREAGSAQRADGSKVNMNVKLYQENKAIVTN